jgi:uncharacterized membrane protein
MWYMITENSIGIDAPAALVWDVLAAVERWPEWTASVERIVPLAGTGIEVGKRFKVSQPRMPSLVWEVTDVERGVSWTWRQRSPGGTTLASHELDPQGADRTLVRLRVEQRGPVGVAFGVLMRRLTKRYLDLEARGLKERSEHLQRGDAPHA